jgi:murein DD-endopeptidase MepM/ murein hydrolase activator NlpD
MVGPLTRDLCTAAFATSGAVALLVGGSAPASAATNVVGTVATGNTALNIRSAPNASASVVGSAPNGSKLTLVCQVRGQSIQGTVRLSNKWDKTSKGYVSDAHIQRGQLDLCPDPSAPSTPSLPPSSSGWVAPVPAKVGQTFRPAGNPSHDGVDIPEPRNTPIHAANGGTVITVTCNTSGTSCDVDGSASVRGCGWYVEVQHANQVVTRYCHMVKRPSVTVGQKVTTGQVLGYVGTSGNSTGTHLHFEVHVGPGYASSANAVDPVAFMKKMGAPLGGA